jgi:hypothetical protein
MIKDFLLQVLFSSKLSFYFFSYFEKIVKIRNGFIKKSYKLKESEYFLNKYFSVFNSLRVLNGPFSGLQYFSNESFGSELLPKLIGYYEKELWPVWDILKGNDYLQVIDIGCAEGYYAVGLGKIFPKSQIFAYDISKKARDLCIQMAEVNNMKSRLNISEKFDSSELKKFDFNFKTLLVCDCEGFEFELFRNIDSRYLKKVDLIIESHDFLNLEISTYLVSKFSETHDVTCIKSIDDIEKAKTYNFSQTSSFNLLEKKQLYSEKRPSIMEWIICISN